MDARSLRRNLIVAFCILAVIILGVHVSRLRGIDETIITAVKQMKDETEKHLQGIAESNAKSSLDTAISSLGLKSPVPASVEKPQTTTFESIKGLGMEDPKVIDYIRKHMLEPPSPLPYNLKHPERVHFSEYGQSEFIDGEIYKGKKHGFFVEAGAFNGEHISNTIYFERELGWTGLLVEPIPPTYKELKSKHRKVYTVNSALSLNQTVTEIEMNVAGVLSRVGKRDGSIKIPAFPLYSLITALNVTDVDYMSIDVEYSDLYILETIPWDKIKVHVLNVESNTIPGGTPYLDKFMFSKGLIPLGIRRRDSYYVSKEVFNNVLKKVNPINKTA